MSPKEGTSGIGELRKGFFIDAEGIAANITRIHSQPAIDFFKWDTSRLRKFVQDLRPWRADIKSTV